MDANVMGMREFAEWLATQEARAAADMETRVLIAGCAAAERVFREGIQAAGYVRSRQMLDSVYHTDPQAGMYAHWTVVKPIGDHTRNGVINNRQLLFRVDNGAPAKRKNTKGTQGQRLFAAKGGYWDQARTAAQQAMLEETKKIMRGD